MATCYICGNSGANFRRSVHTGNTYGTRTSSRGKVSYSNSAHYGIRSVCAECAYSIDYKNQKAKCYYGWYVTGALLFVSIFVSAMEMSEFIAPLWVMTGIASVIAICTYYAYKEKLEEWDKENKILYFPDMETAVIQKNDFLKIIDMSEGMLKACKELLNTIIFTIQKEVKKINGEIFFEEGNITETTKIFEEKVSSLAFLITILHTMFDYIISNLNRVEQALNENAEPNNESEKKLKELCIKSCTETRNSVTTFVESNVENIIENIEKAKSVLKENNLQCILTKMPSFLYQSGLDENYQIIKSTGSFNIINEESWNLATDKPIKIRGLKIRLDNEKNYMTENDYVAYMEPKKKESSKESQLYNIVMDSISLYERFSCKEETITTNDSIVFSDEKYGDFCFSIAQKAIIASLGEKEKNILMRCIKKYLENNSIQELRDNISSIDLSVSQTLLFDLIMCKNVSEEKVIVYQYFVENTKLDTNSIYFMEYFKIYPDVKEKIESFRKEMK